MSYFALNIPCKDRTKWYRSRDTSPALPGKLVKTNYQFLRYLNPRCIYSKTHFWYTSISPTVFRINKSRDHLFIRAERLWCYKSELSCTWSMWHGSRDYLEEILSTRSKFGHPRSMCQWSFVVTFFYIKTAKKLEILIKNRTNAFCTSRCVLL